MIENQAPAAALQPTWCGVVGPEALAAFYRTVLDVVPTILPLDDRGARWVFGVAGDVEALKQRASRAGVAVEGGQLVSPTGTTIWLCDSAVDAALPPVGAGSVAWSELHSPDLEADLAWFAALGLHDEGLPVAGQPYHLLRSHGSVIAGCTAAEVTIGWVPWLRVEDVDQAAAAVRRHGGALLGACSRVQGVGEMIVARDPAGAPFGMLRPAEDE